MTQAHLVEPGTRVRLAEHDPAADGGLDKKAAESRLAELCEELASLQGLLYAANSHALLIVLQGMDGSGKDGTVRSVMSGLNPLGVTVTPFKQPTTEELDHDYLWRIHKAVPRRGEIGIFNRSHYEDVLIVRVHELVPRRTWKARYAQINRFERNLVENRIVLLKFFLHISKAEQKRRFQERLDNPKKYWKFALQDLEERKRWDDYQVAYEEALSKCSTPWAPWWIVPADRKWYRNLVVAEAIVATVRALDLKYPSPTFDRSKIVIE